MTSTAYLWTAGPWTALPGIVKPAGAAAAGEVLAASAIGAALSGALLLVAWAHRTRRTTLLSRAAEAVGRAEKQPGWVALPQLVATPSLLVALLGMFWDISLHIDKGRDPGPLANPAHYLILFGLFGIFTAGTLAVVLPLDEKPGRYSVRVTRHWHAPVGGLLVAAAGAYSLLGFPLDDVWHRLFGQDVTLWGPTHLMLIGGAGLSLVGMLVLQREGSVATGPDGATASPRVAFLRRANAMGGLLIGLSTFQAEFDFGVPQFRLVLQPLLLAVAAGVALVAARLWIGRGGALGAAVFFLLIRSLISLAVGVGWGQTTPSVPLYVGSALLVELVALVLLRRPMLFAVVSGALIGTVGTLTEALWSQAFYRLPWTSDIAVEGTLMAVVGGVAGGVIGALLGLGLTGRLPRPRLARPAFAVALLALAAALANGLMITVPTGNVHVELTAASPPAGSSPGDRWVNASVQLPSRLTGTPAWLEVNAWQGGGLVVSHLARQADGSFRTTVPVPVFGDWKTLLRLQNGRMLAAAPIWLPADPAIPAPEVAATASFDRPLQNESHILQREKRTDIPGWLWTAACLVVLGCSLLLILALAWGLARVAAPPQRQRSTATGTPAPDPAGDRRPEPALV